MPDQNSSIATERPTNIEISFHKLGDMQVARYVSDATVREEALEHGRLIGLYWSATGQVQREDVTATLTRHDNFGITKLNPLAQPLHVFELEIDGQAIRSGEKRTSSKPASSATLADSAACAHEGVVISQ